MKLLAFDTSTENLSLALQVGSQLFTFDEKVGNATSAHILPQIQGLLKNANVTLAELDGIAFGAGPGSFTGVRIAAGVTQGLALGANLPVVGVNTLLALAHGSGADKVIACLDARMGEVYHAAFVRVENSWQEVLPASVCKPENVPQVAGAGWVGVGSGWAVYHAILMHAYQANVAQTMPAHYPNAVAILQLATLNFTQNTASTAHQAMPIYVRNRVALTTQEREQAALK